MKLVIEIDYQAYLAIKNDGFDSWEVAHGITAIKNGTPLNKYRGSTYGGESWGGIYRPDKEE